MRSLRVIFFMATMLLLSGCKLALLSPEGRIAADEAHLLVTSVLLMLIVVVPTMVLSLYFAWRYRRRNHKATYDPSFTHSTSIEVICWAVPCVIIGILGYLTWVTTHTLNPYKPIASKKDTMLVQAVSLDWKWLFIYPKQKVATMNYMAVPLNKPIQLQITADSPMNSIEIPQLAGQIYAMPGMRTKLHLIANKTGNYMGLGTNYTGNGFASMEFTVRVMNKKGFTRWVKEAKRAKQKLNVAEYNKLVKPSSFNKPQTFVLKEPYLFQEIINKYMMPNAKLAQLKQ